MDNFIDKLAQRWNAGELIKANSAAEAMEMKKLREQIAQYEEILQEMRKLNLRNSELAEITRTLMEEGLLAMTELLKGTGQESGQEEVLERLQGQLGEMKELLLQKEDNKQLLEEIANKTEDFIHKENVKVYRNVQAVVTEGLQSQKEEQSRQNGVLAASVKGVRPLLIAVLLLLLGNLAGVAALLLGLVSR